MFHEVVDDMWVISRMILNVIKRHAVATVVELIAQRLRRVILQKWGIIEMEWPDVQ